MFTLLTKIIKHNIIFTVFFYMASAVLFTYYAYAVPMSFPDSTQSVQINIESSETRQDREHKSTIRIIIRGHKELDFGTVYPEKPVTARFYIGVQSMVPYREVFNWSNFSSKTKTISEKRLKIFVGEGKISSEIFNSGTHPPSTSGPHSPSTKINWERVDLLLKLLWSDPIGKYKGCLTIEAFAV